MFKAILGYIIRMTQTFNCTRCSSKSLTENDFGQDKQGNNFKTCNNCRDYSNQRKANNREVHRQYGRDHYQANPEHRIEQIKHWRTQNIERLTEQITCACGGKFQYRTKAEHERTKKHQTYLTGTH